MEFNKIDEKHKLHHVKFPIEAWCNHHKARCMSQFGEAGAAIFNAKKLLFETVLPPNLEIGSPEHTLAVKHAHEEKGRKRQHDDVCYKMFGYVKSHFSSDATMRVESHAEWTLTDAECDPYQLVWMARETHTPSSIEQGANRVAALVKFQDLKHKQGQTVSEFNEEFSACADMVNAPKRIILDTACFKNLISPKNALSCSNVHTLSTPITFGTMAGKGSVAQTAIHPDWGHSWVGHAEPTLISAGQQVRMGKIPYWIDNGQTIILHDPNSGRHTKFLLSTDNNWVQTNSVWMGSLRDQIDPSMTSKESKRKSIYWVNGPLVRWKTNASNCTAPPPTRKTPKYWQD
jgi:hypothetical protein